MKKTICLILLLVCLVLQASAALAGSKECARAEDHTYGPWQVKKTATCTRQGHEFRYCSKCIHWEQRWTKKLPHTPDQWVVSVEPTCTRKGAETATCLECKNEIRRSIDMIEHAYGEVTISTEAKCAREGKGYVLCQGCGRKKYVTLEPLGHDWGEPVATREATCTKAGKGKQSCNRCGREREATIDKLEHVINWEITREPNGRKKGLRTGICALCGAKREENFYWEGTLYVDMEPCEEVIRLQEKLRDLGYYKGSISGGKTGKYGNLTGEAVARFQKANGLKETTVADPQTLAAIEEAWGLKTGAISPEALDLAEMENAQEAQQIEE